MVVHAKLKIYFTCKLRPVQILLQRLPNWLLRQGLPAPMLIKCLQIEAKCVVLDSHIPLFQNNWHTNWSFDWQSKLHQLHWIHQKLLQFYPITPGSISLTTSAQYTILCFVTSKSQCRKIVTITMPPYSSKNTGTENGSRSRLPFNWYPPLLHSLTPSSILRRGWSSMQIYGKLRKNEEDRKENWSKKRRSNENQELTRIYHEEEKLVNKSIHLNDYVAERRPE